LATGRRLPTRAQGKMADQGWVEAVGAAFDGLQQPHREKKKATIIALVDARLAGRSEETVWKLPGVCNRGTYHLKWKKQADFVICLDRVSALATDWRDGRAIRALQEAAERLALATPVAVGKAIVLLGSDDERVRLQAAFGILDRAGVETAAKVAGEVKVTDARRVRERLAQLLGAEPAGGGETPAAGGAERR